MQLVCISHASMVPAQQPLYVTHDLSLLVYDIVSDSRCSVGKYPAVDHGEPGLKSLLNIAPLGIRTSLPCYA